MQFDLVSVVWGSEFVDGFLRVCLPSLLTPGNLPEVIRRYPASFCIYTPDRDVPRILAAAAYRRLANLMPVRILTIRGMSYVGKYRAMTQCHAHFISRAGLQTRMLFVCPDVAFADGALARTAEIAASGKRMIVFFTPRLQKETFVPALLSRFERGGTMAPIPARELVALAAGHLHAEMRSLVWNKTDALSGCCSGLLWSLGDGLLARQFHLFPWMACGGNGVVPAVSLDADYTLRASGNMEEVYVVTDSDDICAMDFTSASDAVSPFGGTHRSPRAVAEWAAVHTHSVHRAFVREKIRFHSLDLSAGWVESEAESDRVVAEVLSLLDRARGAKEEPVAPSWLRFASPSYCVRKLREYGPAELARRTWTRLSSTALRAVYGPQVRIAEYHG